MRYFSLLLLSYYWLTYNCIDYMDNDKSVFVPLYFVFVLTCNMQNEMQQCTVMPKCLTEIGAEVSGQFGTGAELSGHFCTSAEMSWCRSVPRAHNAASRGDCALLSTVFPVPVTIHTS